MIAALGVDYIAGAEPENSDVLSGRQRARVVLTMLKLQQKDLQIQLDNELARPHPNTHRINRIKGVLNNIRHSLSIHNR